MTVKVTCETAGRCTFLRWHISRPERMNALGTTVSSELEEALNLAKTQMPQGVRALVITAETVHKNGRATWIAGGDLKELATLTTKAQGLAYAQSMHRLCRELDLLPIPVICFVDGAAIGGGAELAIAADIRIGTPAASFEWKQLKMGLTTGYGATSRLCDLLGKAQAQKLLFFCESLSATDAVKSGVLHRVVENYADLCKFIEQLSEIEPLALAAQKRLFHLTSTMPQGETSWADQIFHDIWGNSTHSKVLQNFKMTE